MKIIPSLVFVSLALTAARGQDPVDLNEILRQRDALLTEMVATTQNRLKVGAGTEEQVRDATINLYAFRRDSAKTLPERLQWQERIIAIEKEAEAKTKKQVETGNSTPFDALVAEERTVAAKQKLWEIQLAK